jgi:hypothetical protein
VKIDFSKLLKISVFDVWKYDPPRRILLSIAAGATRGRKIRFVSTIRCSRSNLYKML